MQIIKDIYLDFYDNHFVTVNAKQNDTGRYIRAEIIKDGTGFEIPSGAVVSIASETIWNNCEVEGNKILAPLSKVMLDTAGERICQLEIVKGEEKLTTVSFQLKIEKSVRNDGAIEGNMELGVLDQAISDAKRITQEAETTEAARKTAENARISAENTRKNQETARVNAETSRVSAENTRKSQETARDTAETARVAAENTRKSQETGRVNAESARVTEFASLKAESEDATARAEAAAAGDISNKTVTYTESTAVSAPASGSKLSAISGWLIGKVKNLVTRMGTAETSISQLNSNLGQKLKVFTITKWTDPDTSWTVTAPYGPFILLTNSALYIGFKYAKVVNFFEVVRKASVYTVKVNSDESMTINYEGPDGYAASLICINVN